VVRIRDLDIGLLDACSRFGRFAPRRDGLRKPAEPNSLNVSGIIPVQNVDNHTG